MHFAVVNGAGVGGGDGRLWYSQIVEFLECLGNLIVETARIELCMLGFVLLLWVRGMTTLEDNFAMPLKRKTQ